MFTSVWSVSVACKREIPDGFTCPSQCGSCLPTPTSLLGSFLRDCVHCHSVLGTPVTPVMAGCPSAPSSDASFVFHAAHQRVQWSVSFLKTPSTSLSNVGETTLGPSFGAAQILNILFLYHAPILGFKNILYLHSMGEGLVSCQGITAFYME